MAFMDTSPTATKSLGSRLDMAFFHSPAICLALSAAFPAPSGLQVTANLTFPMRSQLVPKV